MGARERRTRAALTQNHAFKIAIMRKRKEKEKGAFKIAKMRNIKRKEKEKGS